MGTLKLNFYSLGYLFLAIASGVFYGFGGAVLKKGALNFKESSGVFDLARNFITNKFILVSLLCSGLGYIICLYILRKTDVITTTLVIQSVLFLSTSLFAALMFGETFGLTKIIAVLLIMAGIAVLLAG